MIRQPRSPRVSLALSIFFGFSSFSVTVLTALASATVFLSCSFVLKPTDKTDKVYQFKNYGSFAISLSTMIILIQPFYAFSKFLSRKEDESYNDFLDSLPSKSNASDLKLSEEDSIQ